MYISFEERFLLMLLSFDLNGSSCMSHICFFNSICSTSILSETEHLMWIFSPLLARLTSWSAFWCWFPLSYHSPSPSNPSGHQLGLKAAGVCVHRCVFSPYFYVCALLRLWYRQPRQHAIGYLSTGTSVLTICSSWKIVWIFLDS